VELSLELYSDEPVTFTLQLFLHRMRPIRFTQTFPFSETRRFSGAFP